MKDGARVMVVEDDPAVRTVVVDHLRLAGCRVVAHHDGAQAWEAFCADTPDLLVLDRMLPGLDGDEICRRVRTTSDVPVIMLTALDGVDNRIVGLESGADDYLTKPFSLRELQLRVNAQLRRSAAPAGDRRLTVGPFTIDTEHRRVWVRGAEVSLTTREYELLVFLVRNPGVTVSRDDILRDVWRWGFGDPSTVTVHVRRLREKIEDDPAEPRFLTTQWGAGYRLEVKS